MNPRKAQTSYSISLIPILMSTMKIAVVLSVFWVLVGGLSIGPALVYAQGASVSIQPNHQLLGDKAFSPNPAELKAGESVTWTNDDSQIHTATSGAVGGEDSGKCVRFKYIVSKSHLRLQIRHGRRIRLLLHAHPQMFGKVVVS